MSAHSAGAYTATLLVMVNVMRGGGRAPSPARANFTLMTECTPENSGCYSVYSVRSTVNLGEGGGACTGFLETKAKRDSQGTLEKVSFFVWYSQSGTREYLPALAGLADLVLENIFPTG